MNLIRTTPIAVLFVAALSACAPMPAATTTPHSPGAASGHRMQTAPAEEKMAMMDSHMTSMREMHERMKRARTPDERRALRADHMKMMHDGMAMMGGIGPAGETKVMKGMHGGGTDMSQHHQMMEKRMDMMQSMMQMMMDQMPPIRARP
jgi:hypothetical protein